MYENPKEPPLQLEWVDEWTPWDYHKIFYRYVYEGKRLISEEEYKYARDFYNEFNTIEHADEWGRKKEQGRFLFMELDDRGAFNMIKTKFPYPLHYDPECRDLGLYTERHANLKAPDNLILGVSAFSADHSHNVNAHDFQLVATALHFDAAEDAYNRLRGEVAGDEADEIEPALDLIPPTPLEDHRPQHNASHVIYAPSRYLLRWGAPDEPDGGYYFFAAIVGAFVTAWIILISFLTGGMARTLRHWFLPVHHRAHQNAS